MSDLNIIGAAITGPATALRQARLGHNVTVYEQRNADELASAGILGITHGNWKLLQSFDVDVDSRELDNGFRDYSSTEIVRSPFRYITWTGLHTALQEASEVLGVRYVYGKRVLPNELSGIVVEATGVAGAARIGLPHQYAGVIIYRGLSRLHLDEPFIAYREQSGMYLTIGETPDGAFWAYFVPRKREPRHLGTTDADGPPSEAMELPDDLRRIVYSTETIVKTPISNWEVPAHMHNADYTYFTLGDVNGPIRPVTTSGANLAVIEGLNSNHLIGADSRTVLLTESDMLNRRAYDLVLGQQLDGPEIGGEAEDIDYYEHHMMLFKGESA